MVECVWDITPVSLAARGLSTRTRPHSATQRESSEMEPRALQLSPTVDHDLSLSTTVSGSRPHSAALSRTQPHSAALSRTQPHSAALGLQRCHTDATHRHQDAEPPHGGAGGVSRTALVLLSRTHRAAGRRPARLPPLARMHSLRRFMRAARPPRPVRAAAYPTRSRDESRTRGLRHGRATTRAGQPKAAAQQRRGAHHSGRGSAHPPSVD